MPRGVKGSGKAKQPARRQVAAVAPKAAPKQMARAEPEAQARSPEPAAASSPLAPENTAPLASLDVDRLAGQALRTYARRAGVPQRDVDNLTEDRLRQNVKLTIARHFELISEEA